jgi:hypothetical protein
VRFVRILIWLLFLLMSLPGPTLECYGQNRGSDGDSAIKWEKYDSDPNGIEYFYDKGSITYPTPKIVQVRRRRVFPDGASYRSITTLDQIDCDKQKYRSIEIKVTDRKGATEEFAKASQWANIHFGMPEGYFLREHCK